MQTVVFILLLVTLINLLLAALVLLRRPHEEINRVFALTAFSVALWTLTNALFQATDSTAVATLWAQISYSSAVAIAASFLHFSWIYPRCRIVVPYAKPLLWTTAAVIGALPFVPGLVIRSVELNGNRSIGTNGGVYLIALFMFATSAWAFWTFTRNYNTLRDTARAQVHYVLFGSGLTAIFGLTFNLLLPLAGNYGFVWLGPASSLFFVGFTVYAIVTQHLFDIRLVIKRTLVYSLLLAGIAGGYSAVEYVLKETLQQTVPGNGHPILSNIGGAIIVSLFASPVRHWLEQRIDLLVFGHTKYKKHDQE